MIYTERNKYTLYVVFFQLVGSKQNFQRGVLSKINDRKLCILLRLMIPIIDATKDVN